MKLLTFAVFSVLCALSLAISFPMVASVSLLSVLKPAFCFFGIFRRRKSPVQETSAPMQPPSPFQQMSDGFFNPFAGGMGGMFFPGFNNPGFGMFHPSNRFPPQVKPTRPAQPQWIPQHKPQQVPPSFPPRPQPAMPHFPPQNIPSGMEDFGDSQEDSPGMNTEEAESFFTLLSETDESKCISRLVCEMGANPQSGGEFGQTIVEIIGGLNDFPDGSRVAEYNEVLNTGVREGLSGCVSKFSTCDEESFQLVKKAQLEDEQNE